MGLSQKQLCKVLAAELKDLYGAEALKPGRMEIGTRLAIDVHGMIEQKPTTLYVPTAEIPVLDVLARLVHLGHLKMRTLENLADLIIESLTAGRQPGEGLDFAKSALALVRQRLTSQLPKKERAGQLIRNLELKITMP